MAERVFCLTRTRDLSQSERQVTLVYATLNAVCGCPLDPHCTNHPWLPLLVRKSRMTWIYDGRFDQRFPIR
jgi:hypothetical protein